MPADGSWIRDHIRAIADHPQPGITFRDITPLLGDGPAFGRAIDDLIARFDDVDVSRVVGIESRGFILGAAIAYRLRAGFVPVRKAGKLPGEVAHEDYELEYGTDRLEIHRDAINSNEPILVVDDVLATGGTARATANLVESLGARVVGIAVLMELTELGGRARLDGHRVESLTTY